MVTSLSKNKQDSFPSFFLSSLHPSKMQPGSQIRHSLNSLIKLVAKTLVPPWLGTLLSHSGSFLFPPRRLGGRRQWHPIPVLLPGKCHGWRSLVGCSPWGFEELDMTERLHFHFSPSCIGEGNGNPLQYSCLENPRDGGAWWAAVCGVTQSRTRLKWLSSSIGKVFQWLNSCLLLVHFPVPSVHVCSRNTNWCEK